MLTRQICTNRGRVYPFLMENYVLYDEVGRGEHSIVYKGRKKGTIEFVAIHCVEKCKRLELRNIVRLTHEMDHTNVVRFHEWYETANHIWMVAELCTGDSLDTVLAQDGHLPEETVKSFATEIAKGLLYIHSLGILYCDLRPSRIMLDGAGILKLSDFALARVEGETNYFDALHDDGDRDFDEGINMTEKDSETERNKKPKASPHYMAPEVLAGAPPSREADLWSFGCVLYEMFTGEQPFTADSFPELVSKVFNESVKYPVKRENNDGIAATQEFDNLIKSLLQKDENCRLNWEGLITHPFWQGSLTSGLKDIGEHEQEAAAKDQMHVEVEDSEEINCNNNQRGGLNRVSELKDKVVESSDLLSAPGDLIRQGTYTCNSRPHTTDCLSTSKECKAFGKTRTLVRHTKSDGHNERVVNSGNKQKEKDDENGNKNSDSSMSIRRNPTSNNKGVFEMKSKGVNPPAILEPRRLPTVGVGTPLTDETDSQRSISDLINHQTDFEVTPIADNPKIKKFSLPKWDPKALPCQSLKPNELLDLSKDKFEEHLTAIGSLLSQKNNKSSTGPIASLHRSKLHTSLYLASLTRNGEIANALFESDLLSVILHQIKSGFSADFKARLGYVLSLLAGNATVISEEFNMMEVFTVLTEVIRDNFRNAHLKQHLLPALGEFLFYAATQEEIEGYEIAKWEVPGVTYTIILRCLHEGEDIVVQHFAAKAIENVAATRGRHCSKFATNEAAQLLWNLYTHCTDVQKVTAISALCRLTSHSPSVLQHVIEKAGFKTVLGAFSTTVPRIQQSLLTMFITVLSARAQVRRLIQEKDLITRALRLFESPSMVIRAKAFLFVLFMVQSNPMALLLCCQARLVMYIERELKRSTPVKGESAENRAYLAQCQNLCVSAIVDAAPSVLRSVLASLDAVEGRRHPSAGQAKQLRIHLPLLSIILHLVTSHAFRSQIVNQEFLTNVGALLGHVNSIDSGSTSIGSAAGPNAAEDLTAVSLSIAEAITQHPPILLSYHALVTEHVLPHLASLMSSSNGDTRVLCFRLFADVASLYFDNQNVYSSSSTDSDVQASTKRLNEVVSSHLLPQYHLILLDQDPLPAYGLKLLLSFLERSPDIVQIFVNQGLLATMCQILQSHSERLDRGMTQSMVGLLNCLTTSEHGDMRLLYKQGLVDILVSLFVEVVGSQNGEDVTAETDGFLALLLPLLDNLSITLRYVSKEVRKALQANAGAEPEKEDQSKLAEYLLVETKPLVDIMSMLINLLCHEDMDVRDSTCRCLYLMVELFGGLFENALSTENVECLSEALKTSNVKKQKQLLRIIKRLMPAPSMVDSGQVLVHVLKGIQSGTDSSTDEGGAIQTLIQDILSKLDTSS